MSLPPLTAWLDAGKDASFSDPAACAARASKFERSIRLRNSIEYSAGGLMTLLFGASAVAAMFRSEWMIGISMFITMIGITTVMWNLRRRGSNLVRRPEDPCVVHLRSQYVRQFEALRAVPRWYLGPLIPGMALLYVSIMISVAEVTGWQQALRGIAWPVAATVALFGAIALINWIAARSIRRKIEAIDALA